MKLGCDTSETWRYETIGEIVQQVRDHFLKFISQPHGTNVSFIRVSVCVDLLYFRLGFASLKSTAWRTLNDLFCPHFSPHVLAKVTRGVRRHCMVLIKIFRHLNEYNLWFCDWVTCLLWVSNEFLKSNFFCCYQWSALSLSFQVLHHCLVLVRREWSVVSLAVDRQEQIF